MENEELITEETDQVVNDAVNQPRGLTGLIDAGVPFNIDQNQNIEESSEGGFAAPFNSKFGNSSVDLTI